MRLLLDTCTFLWIAEGSASLSPAAARVFADPDNAVFLSTASAWEVAVKYALGRLPLPGPPGEVVPQFREVYRVESLPIDERSALLASRLPRLHADPFDRMLVCQALVHGLTILTPDPLIAAYPVRTTW